MQEEVKRQGDRVAADLEGIRQKNAEAAQEQQHMLTKLEDEAEAARDRDHEIKGMITDVKEDIATDTTDMKEIISQVDKGAAERVQGNKHITQPLLYY